jgi:hypothetical protein
LSFRHELHERIVFVAIHTEVMTTTTTVAVGADVNRTRLA